LNYLYVYPVTGLYEELYNPNPDEICGEIQIKNNCLKPNGLFWYNIFSPNNLYNLIEQLELYAKTTTKVKPQFLAILSNKKKFVTNVQKALVQVCEQGNDLQTFFKNVEMLNISVDLYNTFGDSQLTLSLQDGYLCENQNYKAINDICLIKKYNPYLEFIETTLMPLIKAQNADIVFLVGKISCFNISIAKILRVINPKIKICITRHSSEYYSLNKILNYLMSNDLLFLDVDYIILEQFSKIEAILLETLEKQQSIDIVPNIIYKAPNNSINQTAVYNDHYKHSSVYTLRSENTQEYKINPTEVADVCFMPQSKCYWNKCTFCGINKKYLHDYRDFNYHDYVKMADRILEQLPKVRFFWFVDEALTFSQLSAIASSFINSGKNLFWQARTRIAATLLSDKLIEKLRKSGLKEIRLGLESASYTILRKMNKFDSSFSLDIVKKIVHKYSKNGISVHFPVIIGFPGETEYDRQLTYEFLKELKLKYLSVSFNINVLNLDVSSTLFKKWYEFDINSVSLPCNPKYFVGNYAEYITNFTRNSDLEKERNDFMREQLYPWYPTYAITNPVVFYRLSESSRNTLTSKAQENQDYLKQIDNNASYILDSETVFRFWDNQFFVYNFTTHHYMRCNRIVIKILSKFKTTQTIESVKNCAELMNYSSKDIDNLMMKLIKDGYVIEVEN